MSCAIDWAGLMRLGLGRLRLKPAQFWALSPVELIIMAGLDSASVPMGRTGLAALMATWPDAKESVDDAN